MPDGKNFRRKKEKIYFSFFSLSQRVSFREIFRIKFGIFREFSRDGKEKEGDGSEVVNGFNGRRRETIESFLFQDFQKKGNRRGERIVVVVGEKDSICRSDFTDVEWQESGSSTTQLFLDSF